MWLLARAKKTPATLASAQAYIAEGFQPLIASGVAASVKVKAWWQANAQGAVELACVVDIYNAAGQVLASPNYQWAWDQLS